MTGKMTSEEFGLIIVGNEVLDGRVHDTHFEAISALLAGRNLRLAYSMILPDNPDLLDEILGWAFGRGIPFFCCGGIGSTPDDYTRGCAARAAGVPLEVHAEGERILRERFGPDLGVGRLRLVEFPRGSDLIPNPVNRVPGFRILDGFFLPGFPSMAAPMAEWVLRELYAPGEAEARVKLLLPGAREGDLVPMMDKFVAAHPDVRFSSLPRYVPGGTEVELGLAGRSDAVQRARKTLVTSLTAGGVVFEDRTSASV